MGSALLSHMAMSAHIAVGEGGAGAVEGAGKDGRVDEDMAAVGALTPPRTDEVSINKSVTKVKDCRRHTEGTDTGFTRLWCAAMA